MKKNPHIIALNLAAFQCQRLAAFLNDQSASVDARHPKALKAEEARQLMEDFSGLLFEVANLVELTGKGCQMAAAPKLPKAKIQK